MKDLIKWIKDNDDVTVTFGVDHLSHLFHIDMHEVDNGKNDLYPECSIHGVFDGGGKDLLPRLDRMKKQLMEEKEEFEDEGVIVVAAWNENANEKPIIAAFDNKRAADAYYEYLMKKYPKCIMEGLDILSEFVKR